MISLTHSWYRINYSIIDESSGRVSDTRSNLLIYNSDFESKVSQEVLLEDIMSKFANIQVVEYGTFKSLPSLFSSQDECFLHLLKLKLWANHLVGLKDFQSASENYRQGTNLINSIFRRRSKRDLEQVIVPIYLNLAHCQLKLCQWTEAINSCTFVIDQFENQNSNVKAFFRRAIGRLENRDLPGAKKDLSHVLQLDANNIEALKLLNRINHDMVNPLVEVKIEIDNLETKTLRFRLHKHLVPRTVENFLLLGEKFRGCPVFKSIQDQFFQTGDYEFHDGSGGDCAVKEDRVVHGRRFFNDEIKVGKCVERGVIAMANYGPNTNGSQFVVTLGRLESCAKLGVPFGELVSGWDVIDEINSLSGDPLGDWRPSKPIRIQSVAIV